MDKNRTLQTNSRGFAIGVPYNTGAERTIVLGGFMNAVAANAAGTINFPHECA